MVRKLKRAAKAKAAPRRKATKPPSDAALIRECVIFAQSLAAADAGYIADPDGDSKYAGPPDSRYLNRAAMALEKISNTPATTLKGLQAKARIVPLAIKEIPENRNATSEDVAFLLAFATEVKEHLETIVHQRWSDDYDKKAATENGKVVA